MIMAKSSPIGKDTPWRRGLERETWVYSCVQICPQRACRNSRPTQEPGISCFIFILTIVQRYCFVHKEAFIHRTEILTHNLIENQHICHRENTEECAPINRGQKVREGVKGKIQQIYIILNISTFISYNFIFRAHCRISHLILGSHL